MLNAVEVRKFNVQRSTVLSQVELCFICPQCSFFSAKSRSILLPLCRTPTHPPLSTLLVRFLLILFYC
jgi:hypothetical protein